MLLAASTVPECSRPASAAAPQPCRHCGAPLTEGRLAATGFCCSGCAYVYRLIQEQGLDGYYQIKDPVTAPADAGVFQPRDYAWLDAAQAAAEGSPGALAAVSAQSEAIPAALCLDVQGISCAGCIWLIERLYSAQPGAGDIVVNAQLGTMRLRWMPGAFRASDWARRLQRFGYVVGPAGAKPEDLESRGLARRIGLCGAFSLNVMLFTLPAYLGMSPDFEYAGLFRLLSFLFATLSLLAGGTYFIARAARAVRARAMHLDLPIAIGICGAYAGSVLGWAVGQSRFVYWDFVATFILLMLVGRWAQVAAVERNRRRLLKQQPLPAGVRLAEGGEVARERLQTGQLMLIGPGQTVPVEGQLETGPALFSLASISGEAEPRLYHSGQRIPAGAVKIDRGDARLAALQPWTASLLAQLLAPSERTGARLRLFDRIVRGYVWGIIGASALAAGGWWLATGDWVRSGSVGIAVLVVSCPCAIGLALPLIDELATTALRRRGVFVREADLWARLGKVRKIIFDKTGTLTLETPELLNPEALEGLDARARRALFSLVEGNFHPVGQGLLEHLLATGSVAPAAGQVEEVVGSGVKLGPWTLGRAGWCDDGANWSGTLTGMNDGATVLAYEGRALARFRFADALRPGTAAEVARLRRQSYQIYILSGDRADQVRALAASLDLPVERAIGGMSPADKARWIETHASGDALMLGDGANDSLAFDRALCRGTPVIHRGILERKADFYYLRRGIGGIADLFAIDGTRRRVQRLVLAFSICYNLSAAGLAVAGCVNPLVAAVLMPASSLLSLAIVTVGMRATLQPRSAS